MKQIIFPTQTHNAKLRLSYLAEIYMRNKLNNPYFTQLYGYNIKTDHIWIGMEPMSFTVSELIGYMKSKEIFFNEETFGYIIVVILKAIQEMRNKNFPIFDFKLSNLFVNWDGEIKIGDFGINVDEFLNTYLCDKSQLKWENLYSMLTEIEERTEKHGKI